MRTKNVADFTKDLADLVEARLSTLQIFVEEHGVAPRADLAKFVWGTAKKVFKFLNPQQDVKRKEAWEAAKGMLKDLIDFTLWNPNEFYEPCVRAVLEDKVKEVLTNYHHFVLTGEVRTKHPPPKILGETDELLCIDKPPMFTCNYGGRPNGEPWKAQGCKTATQLLNSNEAIVQIHEYLALKFDYECALATRNFWEEVESKGITQQHCTCGKCGECASKQSGCCNRLDKETSGVMIAAKTTRGFPVVREQFSSYHSMESGGTEKYYLALARGEVKVPTKKQEKSPDWKVEPSGPPSKRRGRIDIALYFDKTRWKALPWDDGNGDAGESREKNGNRKVYGKQREDREEGVEEGEALGGKLDAVTFYEPIAWFSDRLKSEDQYTLLHLQIITGRTHQIRFHCSQLGHPLVGDCQYGAPQSDRDWARRMCLHSYQTKFMEPFSEKWFQATSPLPKDLGDLMSNLRLQRVKEGCPLFLSRRPHQTLQKIFKQYDNPGQLLEAHAPPSKAVSSSKDQGKTRNGMLDAQEAPEAPSSAASWSADNNEWGWNGQKSWNDWHSTENNDRKDWGVASTARSQTTKMEDDDDETWGTWKPLPAQPVPEPSEPPSKRPRTDQASETHVPRTPIELQAPDVKTSPWRRKESTRQAGVFYYINMDTMETQVEPPAPWEKKQSRRDVTFFYYWNPITNITSVDKPEI